MAPVAERFRRGTPPPSGDGCLSENTGHSLVLTFINRSHRAVVLQWINSYGKPVTYMHLPAGESYEQPTFATHPWLITPESGTALMLVIAGQEPGTVTGR